MTVEEWWPALDADSRTWLIENNGDNVIATVAAAITAVRGSVTPGIPLTDDEVDWIEAKANDETNGPNDH